MFVGNKCLGLMGTIGETYSDLKYQRCIVHFYRNAFSVIPKSKKRNVANMLNAIHAKEDGQSAREKAKYIGYKKQKRMGLIILFRFNANIEKRHSSRALEMPLLWIYRIPILPFFY
jgi:transposase-like protein